MFNYYSPGTIFVAWESERPVVVGVNSTAGTMYFVREGNSGAPLKIDMYPFQWKGEEMVEISDRDYKNSKKIGYHHCRELPDFMKEKAPDWANNKTQEVLERLQKS